MEGDAHGRPAAAVGRLVGRVTSLPELPAVAAALLGFAAMVETVLRGVVSGALQPAALLLAVCATAPVALLRTRPMWAAAATTAAAALTLMLYPRPPTAVLAAEVVALYVVGCRHRATTTAWFVPPFVAYAILGPPGGGLDGRMFALVVAAATVGAAGAGVSVRARAATAADDESRQAMAKTLLAYAARGERARIARELHDVVAHHISMIAVQAETARLTTPGLPPDGAKRLLAIGDTARAALTEMRRLLGVLREDAEEPGLTGPNRTPQPGLRQLTELLDEARDSTGAGARLLVRGRVVPLAQGVQLTTYRIVPEALTNVRRHAPGAAVDVELAYTSDALRVRVRVRDNGPGPVPGQPAGAGHGLLGMRERVATLGGELWTGPAPGGGFLVDAVLPLPEEAPSATPVAAGPDGHRRARTVVGSSETPVDQ
ncbi:sensor histidine kinase [Micromonospora sp. NBC_00898]|uniref:sensor histidine kinase n=1 Tax=Micromonospora sp. NBC_00898 TaxID=2975981 RepID=UPI00386AB33A|nr:sensor histidine kinase [Micromonospora sp. NBC_00898]